MKISQPAFQLKSKDDLCEMRFRNFARRNRTGLEVRLRRWGQLSGGRFRGSSRVRKKSFRFWKLMSLLSILVPEIV
ncbi:hypothetical protein RISK_001781 [Rhodopirellula islandica]|uniref:Uncharacterized protein n=1 Tax=Rhodopirellula islandica TaxID=595434 RepID=A0A0J1BHC2_RHOIS|nr:hypothetical protein RISK_001781 [Rhodopirellula islandica]